MISIELAYALPDKQDIIALKVEPGTSVYDAALQSGICARIGEIDLDQSKMGIFGKIVKAPKSQAVKAGDRIEIYRPLILDARAQRMQRAKETGTKGVIEVGQPVSGSPHRRGHSLHRSV